MRGEGAKERGREGRGGGEERGGEGGREGEGGLEGREGKHNFIGIKASVAESIQLHRSSCLSGRARKRHEHKVVLKVLKLQLQKWRSSPPGSTSFSLWKMTSGLGIHKSGHKSHDDVTA